MSTTYIATIVSFLTLALPTLGIEVVERETLIGAITTLVGVISTIYIFIGRYRAGGINVFGLRKS